MSFSSYVPYGLFQKKAVMSPWSIQISIEVDQVKGLKGDIEQQIAATATSAELNDHRVLVENRWEQLQAFALPDISPSRLSPNTKKMKLDAYGDGSSLNTSLLKSCKKKFQGFMQALTNASDRLNEVHREEVGSLYFA